MRSFLGACNVYRRFVPGMAKLAKPLNDMLKKGAEPDFSEPTVVQSKAFESLKAALVSPPVLTRRMFLHHRHRRLVVPTGRGAPASAGW